MSTNLPQRSTPQARLLAWWRCGSAPTRSCGRLTLATLLALLVHTTVDTLEQRRSDWCRAAPATAGAKRQRVEVTTCCVPVLGWIGRVGQGTQLARTVAATTFGDRCVVLAVSVVDRGLGIPVAWTILPAGHNQAWRRAWLRLLRLLRPALPSDWPVLVLADRGVSAPWLFRRSVRRGWHPLLRSTQGAQFRPAGQARCSWRSAVVGTVGDHWHGPGTACTSKDRQVPCTRVAGWGDG